MPDPERPADNQRPGDEVDRMLYEMTELRQGVAENSEHLEERMDRLRVAIVQDREDCSVVEARGSSSQATGPTTPTPPRSSRASGPRQTRPGSLASSRVATTVAASRPSSARAVEALLEYGEIEVDPIRTAEPPSRFERLFGRSGDDDAETGVETNWNEADSSIPDFDTNGPPRRRLAAPHEPVAGRHRLRAIRSRRRRRHLLAGADDGRTVGIAYTIYGRVTAVPHVESLSVERELETEDPQPGDEVSVTVTVRNEGDSIPPDLRLVDTVPDAFVVTDGVLRLHTALRPGSSATFSYVVRVERGEYRWPLVCVSRDFSGGAERTSLLTPETELTCVPSLKVTNDVPVRAQTTQYSGDVNTQKGGSGLEFHSVRDYLPGDPMNRINWKQVADR